VDGRITDHPSRTYALGQDGQGAIRQNLNLDAFRAETGLPLAPVMVLQTGAPSDGLLRHWPEPSAGVDMHYGYAFQWFGLCALIGSLFVWFQLVRPFLHRPRRA
jgi:surfeit locus 1 family protein